MRRNRLVCYLLSLVLFLSSFLSLGSIKASAATNLINPDLSQWTSPFDGLDLAVHAMGSTEHRYFRLTPELAVAGNPPLYVGCRIDNALLVSGNSYTFSFHLPSWDEVRAYTGYQNSDDWFASAFSGNNVLIFGFGSRLPDGSFECAVEFLTLNNSNYQNYLGKDFVKSFTCPDYEGTDPFIFIQCNKNNDSAPLFLDSSLMLIDNDEKDEEGFLAKLFDWFEEKFNNISSNFSALKNKFNELGSNIGGFFSDLGSDIGDWFSELGDNLRNWLNNLKQSVIDLGEKLINGIKSLFVPEDDFFDSYKSQFIALLQNNLGFIYQSADFVTDILDQIKVLLFDSQGRELKLIFPGVSFDIAGYDVDLFSDMEVDFNFLGSGAFSTLYGIYKVILYVIFGVALVQYAMQVWDRTMQN